MQVADKRIYRSQHAYIGGVCAGIAERFDCDPIVIRILAILLAGLTLGLAVVAYAALWASLPRESDHDSLYDVTPESAESSAYGCFDCTRPIAGAEEGDNRYDGLPVMARLAVAVCLMLLFLAVAVNLSPLVPGTQWWQFWPLGLLMAGLCLIVIPVRSRYETAWHALGIVVTSLAATALPMSLGAVSWHTVPCALQLFWPIAVAAVVLFAVGMARRVDALVLAGAFCVVALCLLGSTYCALPGELESIMLSMPDGRGLKIMSLN